MTANFLGLRLVSSATDLPENAHNPFLVGGYLRKKQKKNYVLRDQPSIYLGLD